MCRKRGDHFCEPRARHAQAFCEELLVHTKDAWARQPFVLEEFQREDIVRPLFGTVRWSEEWRRYVRRYRIAWIEVGRKNGKSELLAFIALYLLIADGVEGAEIYGCATDKSQAGKVFDVAARMVRLSPTLSKRLRVRDHIKRIVDDQTGSYYEVVPSDTAGNLGHNPNGVIHDEFLTAKDGDFFGAMRTAMGTRTQPLYVIATTAGNADATFAKGMHDEAVRVSEDPERAPHWFVYVRTIAMDADPFDEDLWPQANPALGLFLSWDSLRDEAREARNDPAREQQFRQYRANQWTQAATRWMPMHLYDRCAGSAVPSTDWLLGALAGRTAWGGLDLSSKLDLTAWCLVVPDGLDGAASVVWRFWLPEARVPDLDRRTDGKVSRWVRGGWVTATEGDVIDYHRIYEQISTDCAGLHVVGIDYDPWSGEPVRQELEQRTGIEMVPVPQTYAGMTPGMTELMALTKSRGWTHHANPVAGWCFDAVEVRSPLDNPDLIRPVKPDRDQSGRRIDAVPAAAMAVGAWSTRGRLPQEDTTMVVLG